MPTCAHCSGTNFSCQDGMFFCVECDTQSQDFVDEQASELLAGPSFTTKQLRQTKEKKVVDKGLPWNTAEGFQLIIKAHVNALIDLGMNPALDEVMQQIWFQYVHKSGLAVMNDDLPSDQKRDVRFRDYFLEHFREEMLPVARKVPTEVKIRLSKSRKSKSDPNLSEYGGATSGGSLERDEEWFSVDTAPSSDEATDSSRSDRAISSAYKPLRRGWHSIGVMSCMKIVCFCHIALQWCKEPVTVGDLIHWIEIGRLPYFGAIECLLPHMKLSNYDHHLFARQGLPKYEHVVIVSESLTKYLGIPALPEINVMQLVFRYLVQLNLPLSFMAYIKNMSAEINTSRTQCKSARKKGSASSRRMLDHYCPDLLAAGLIGSFLKLLFGLNDHIEWKMDVQSKVCDIHEKEGGTHSDMCHMFTWKNWFKYHLLQQEHTSQNEYTIFEKGDPTVVGDVHKCMEHYLALLTKGSTSVKSDQKRRKERAETKPLVFRKMGEKQGSMEAKDKWKQKRLSGASLYKLLGYGNINDNCDFTKLCTRTCVKAMEARKGVGYVAYSKAAGQFQDTSYHRSYRFLLGLLSEITHAPEAAIHSYISNVESRALCPFMEKLQE